MSKLPIQADNISQVIAHGHKTVTLTVVTPVNCDMIVRQENKNDVSPHTASGLDSTHSMSHQVECQGN